MVILATLLGCIASPLRSTIGSTPDRCSVRFPILYLDMDGTTLDSGRGVRQDTADALAAFKACGGLVGFASGRTPAQMQPYLGSLAPDLPLVLYNGAAIYSRDGSELLSKVLLPVEAVRRALMPDGEFVSGGRTRGLIAQFVGGETLVDSRGADIEDLLRRVKIPSGTGCRFEECVLGAIERGEREAPAKLLAIVAPADADAIATAVAVELNGVARCVVSDARTAAVEVVPAEATKARAIREVTKRAGFGMGDVVVFGDGENDVEMLREAGMGIAMGNCHPRACDAALFRVGDHDTGAIAAVITRFLVRRPE